MEKFKKVKFLYWHDGENAERIESMWVTPYNEYFKIENIPFYVQEYALGDIISIKFIEDQPYVDELVEESGNSTLRIVFYDKSIVQKTIQELKLIGCTSEISDKPFLVAVNIPSAVNYHKIVYPYIQNGVDRDLWDFEEACIASGQEE